MLKSVFVVGALLLVCTIILFQGAAHGSGLDYDTRIQYEREIEEVYWEKRIWPEQNKDPRPSFSDSVSPDQFKHSVDHTLRLTNLLEDYYGQPVSGVHLQQEIERIVRETGNPKTLDRIFSVLDYDPFVVAECFARGLLVRRLVEELYSNDTRVHGPLKEKIQAELARYGSVDELSLLSGEILVRTWIKRGTTAGVQGYRDDHDPSIIELPEYEWVDVKRTLTEKFGDLDVGDVSRLFEERDRFQILTVLESTSDMLKVVSVTWWKRGFEDWWSEVRDEYDREISPISGQFELPDVNSKSSKANSWQSTSVGANVPGSRILHTAVFTGSEMLVFGGNNGMGVYYDVRRYNPTTNSWTQGTTVNRPDARDNHTAVWTGSEMIIWGGQQASYLNTGAKYNPSANTWTDVSNVSRPTARIEHTAVWTGTTMLVWGGQSGGTWRNTGGKYSPGSDVWSTLTTENAPSGRANHTATYSSNSEHMVIFGGNFGGSVLSTGGRYNTFNWTWGDMTTVGAPSARTNHTAVYAPSCKVIIWGGYSGSTALNTGAIYNASSNTWTPITTVTAPSRREGHTAIWTDHTMVVWGGKYGSTLRNSGGTYNPYNNVWKYMTTIGAPSARDRHAAVWDRDGNTGTMIVWGGHDGSYENTGGRYVPPADFQVHSDPLTITSVPGGSEIYVFRAIATSLNGWSNPVNLSCTGLTQLSCVFGSNPITPPSNTNVYTDVTTTLSHSIVWGTYSFDLSGYYDITSRKFPITLIVQDYDISTPTPDIPLCKGRTNSVDVSLTSYNNFDDDVTFECTPHANFTCNWDGTVHAPPQNGTINVGLDITATSSVPDGDYQLEVAAFSHGTYRLLYIDISVGLDEPSGGASNQLEIISKTTHSIRVEKVTGATAYNVYIDDLGEFYSPTTAEGTMCRMTKWTDNMDGTITLNVTMPNESWVVVTATNSGCETSAGTHSSGTERFKMGTWENCDLGP